MTSVTAVPVRRLWQLAGAVALVAVAFAQNGGLITPDTKLDLVLDPVGFLGRALNAWDPQAAFGQVQNQAYGYLWPMGPFFAAGDLLNLPPWVVQRLWWALLLVLAYVGMLRLLALWRVGTPATRIIAAAAFALSPRVLAVLGTISSEAWPLALLPWILIPLVRGSTRGDPRRAAALSAIAVLCLGAVNAVASLMVLLPALLYLLLRERGPRRRSLLGWWLASVALASIWWVIPLVVQSRVAPPFLSAIESAQVTTAPTAVLNIWRGAAQWLAYTGGGGTGAIWDAGAWLAGSPWALVATSAVAALGLGGLAGRVGGERRFLALTGLLGLLIVGLGYAGSLGSPVAGAVQHLLDGPLAPLRNVHKADPLVRLPLTVGLAAGLAALPRLLRPFAARLLERPDPVRRDRYARGLAVLLAGSALVVAVLPALQGRLSPPGSFVAVPVEWQQMADSLASNEGTALLVPASNFGAYSWGRPLDEPMQSLARSRWAVRNAIPLGAPGATRWLDGVQASLAQGIPDAHLADALRAAGVNRVVLRNDLDPFSPAPSAAAARATLVGSPGVRRVAAFGIGGTTAGGLTGFAQGVEGLPALEVFEVDGPAGVDGAAGDAVVVTDPVVVVGGPEAAAGALAGVPTIAAADASGAAADVLTDTYRRRSLNVGAERGRDLTPTLDATADAARGRPAADISPWGPAVPRAELDAPPAATASSSAADPFGIGYRGPGVSPLAAADGDPATTWVSQPGDRDPWWRRDFPTMPVGAVGVQVVIDPVLATVNSVEVEAGGRVVSASVPADGRVGVDLGGVVSDHVTVRLRSGTSEPVALANVTIDGLEALIPTVVVPGSAPAARLAAAPGGRRDCLRTRPLLVTCARGSGVAGEEDAGWSRAINLTSPAELVGATVALRPGATADRLLDGDVAVSSSGAWLDDPLARPGAALDDDPATAWLTRPGDAAPTLTMRYPAPVTVDGLVVVADVTDGRLLSATVTVDGKSHSVNLSHRRTATFPPLTGRTVTVRLGLTFDTPFPADPTRVSTVALLGSGFPATPQRVTVPCGQGPTVSVNGTTVPLSIDASAHDLRDGAVVPAQPCATVSASGASRVTARSDAAFRVVSADLGDVRAPQQVPVKTDRTTDESARWSVPAGDGYRVLATTWGFNAGWQAVLNGTTLTPIRVDGWRQGWVLPATSGAVEVVAEFGPGRWHRFGLLIGGIAVLALLALALLRPRAVTAAAVGPRAGGRWLPVAIAVIVPTLLGGVVGLLVAAVTGVVARRGLRAVAGLGAAGVLASGVVVAVSRGASWGAGVVPGVAQALALLAVGALGWMSARVGTRTSKDGQFDDTPAHFSDAVGDHDGADGQHDEPA